MLFLVKKSKMLDSFSSFDGFYYFNFEDLLLTYLYHPVWLCEI